MKNKKSFLLIFFIAILATLLAIIFEVNSSDISPWLKNNFGENYSVYMIIFFIVAALLTIFLMTSGSHFFNSKKEIQKNNRLQIKWEDQYSIYIKKAKELFSKARQKEALLELSKIKSDWLENEVAILSARLNEHQRLSRKQVQSDEFKDLTINRINDSIISLISEIEDFQKQEEAYIKEVKQYLLKRYKNRLDQKMAGRQPIQPRMLASILGTSENSHTAFVTYGKNELQKNIDKLFEEAHGRILILGEGGAGKSTMLLQLVIKLLETKKLAFPIVLNIATWQSSFQTLEDWLEEILPIEMGADQVTAQKISNQYPLILLLDGFDEMPESERPSFWQALGKFSANPTNQFVITSKIEAYKNTTHDAPVNAQIEIGNLTFEQIEKELKIAGFSQPEAQPLLQAIREDNVLKDAVQNPFYFNALQLLFAHGKRLRELQFSSNDVSERQNEIKKKLVDTLLSNIPKAEFKKEEVYSWLSFFAYEMRRHQLTIFELSNLQYTWGAWTKKELGEAKSLNDVIHDIPQQLKNGSPLFFFPAFIISLYIIIFQMIRILLGIFVKDSEEIYKITTKDKPDWNSKSFFYNSLKEWKIGLFGFILLGGIFILAFGWLIGLLVGLLVFIFITAYHGAIQTLSENHTKFLQINQPYQRFLGSAKALHLSIFQHLLLRYRLSQKKLLPLKLDFFLEKMSEYHLLESDGATWQFRHEILQDLFAKEYQSSVVRKK